ncbi:hypothetical protein ACMHYJ_10065 [Castellaniella hirudinis]|uniref:hypothetical protein n=1 Tax=Castellaniella hirudinis TaxID=1144617 RepID=UPI0039C45DA1
MSNISQFLGGSDRKVSARLILRSQTFIAPISGMYRISVIGGGASGGVSVVGSTGQTATGGGAGGFAQKSVYLKQGDSLTVNVGAGGMKSSNGNGVDGGQSSVAGPAGLLIQADGGKAGRAAGWGTPLTGSEGGAATGGDINNPGGGSGGINLSTAGSAATGGGAVNIFGVDPETIRSGSAVATYSTGGASPGGGSDGGGVQASAGGGVAGPSVGGIPGPDILGRVPGSSPFDVSELPQFGSENIFVPLERLVIVPPFFLVGGGGYVNKTTRGFALFSGGASGGVYTESNMTGIFGPQPSGAFAGSGGLVSIGSGSTGASLSEGAEFGAGAGGVVSRVSATSRGGDGIVVIEVPLK